MGLFNKNNWPWTNVHELNLDWILGKMQEFIDNPPRGEKGDKGDPGPAGPAGPQGSVGPTGPQGVQGVAGPQGPQGPKGEQGDPAEVVQILGQYDTLAQLIAYHPTGEVGDAYLIGDMETPADMYIAVWDNTDNTWIPGGVLGQKGEKGDTGETGPQGPQGPQGIQGETGATGATGPQGPQGEQGPAGAPGVNYDAAVYIHINNTQQTPSADSYQMLFKTPVPLNNISGFEYDLTFNGRSVNSELAAGVTLHISLITATQEYEITDMFLNKPASVPSAGIKQCRKGIIWKDPTATLNCRWLSAEYGRYQHQFTEGSVVEEVPFLGYNAQQKSNAPTFEGNTVITGIKITFTYDTGYSKSDVRAANLCGSIKWLNNRIANA